MISFPVPNKHVKGWGHETWLINCPDYCCKFLDFKKNAKGSMHFHDKKHETWYILSGTICVSWTDANTGMTNEKIIAQGEMVDIPRLQPHQVCALEESRILEVSTQHFEEDSYRVFPGDSQLRTS